MAKTISTGLITDKINGITVNTSIKCNSANYNNSSSRNVKYIVMHYTGNKNKDTAKANCTYFKNGSRGSSAHIFVDNDSIYQSVELRDRAWHCGTSGTYYHKDCRNANSIGVEMCCTSGNYVVSKVTQINAAYVCAYLCKMIGVCADEVDTYVLMHYSITHKNCPAQYVRDIAQWNQFKTWVKNILKTGKHVTTTVATTTTNKIDTVKEVQKWANDNYKSGLTIDGDYGVKTKKALIKILQTELNQTYDAELNVDGVWGDKTKAACPTLKKGIKNDVVGVLQALLVCEEYKDAYIDKDYGSSTEKAVKSFQKNNGLTVDGITGKNTFAKLCS